MIKLRMLLSKILLVLFLSSIFLFYFITKYIYLLFSQEHISKKPLWLVLLMYIGESLCLFTYIGITYYNKKTIQYTNLETIELIENGNEELIEPINIKTLCLKLSLIDMAASICLMFSFTMLSISTISLLRSISILFQSYLSKQILNVTITSQQKKGICLVILGNIIFNFHLSYSFKFLYLLGILLVMMSVFIQSYQIILHQKFIKVINPLKLIGMEGCIGIALSIIVMIIAYILPGNDYNNHFENTLNTINRVYYSEQAILSSCLYVFVKYISNGTGITCLSYYSSIELDILSSLSHCIIWIISLVFYYYSPYSFLGEKLSELWQLQLIGISMVLYGNIEYYKN